MDRAPSPFGLPLVAILRGITPEAAVAHVEALVEAGYDAIEIPTNSPGWERSVALAAAACGGRARIGAGTVLEPAQIDVLLAAGGAFAVTPDARPDVIAHAAARGLPLMAGFATPTEAFAALAAGAPMLKLFPASTFGPGMVQALRAVLPPVPLFAVGGVTPGNLLVWRAAGCQGAGIGGELYRAGQPVERTRTQARRFRQAWMDHHR